MIKTDLLIFDLDGTLVTSGTDLARSINFMLRNLSIEEKPENEIISFVGDGINNLIEKALGQDDAKHHEEALGIFDQYYGTHLLDNTKLYPNVEEVLEKFALKTKIILTNKRYHLSLTIAKGLNIDKHFVEIIGADSTPFRKPDKRVIEHILNKHRADKEKTVMIGDGINDITVANNSGILSCAYLNGLGKRQDLLNLHADYYIENILEINSLFY